MRPEYIEAVDAVRTGWSSWIVWILPVCVVWASVLFRPFRAYRRQKLLVFGAFILANYLYLEGVCLHANRIQSAKKQNMQTQAERKDWSSDTWRVFGPIFAIGPSVGWCTLNLISAGVFRLMINRIRRISRPGSMSKGDQVVSSGER